MTNIHIRFYTLRNHAQPSKRQEKKDDSHPDKKLNLQKSTVRKQENKQTNNDSHPYETLNLQKSNPVVRKGKGRKKRKTTNNNHP